MLPIVFLLQAAPSPFWSTADATCKDVAKLEEAKPEALGAATRERDDLVRYCKFAIAPPFAARDESDRANVLAAIAKAAAIELPPLGTPAVAQATTDVLGAADDELRRDPAPELGLLGEKILGSALGGLCSAPSAKEVLRATCSLGSTASLGALRVAVLRDVLDVFAKRAGEQAPGAVRLLDVVLTPGGLRAAAAAMPRALAPANCEGAACAAPARAGTIAAAFAIRVLADGPKLDRDKEHYRNIAAHLVSVESKHPEAKLSASAVSAVDELVLALRAVDDEERLALHATPTTLAERSLGALRKALVLGVVLAGEIASAEAVAAGGAAASQTAAASQIAAAVADQAAAAEVALAFLTNAAKADAAAAIATAKPILDELVRRGHLTANDVRALEIAAKLSQARTQKDLENAARAALLPLPPWIDKFAFDLNVAPPVNKHVHGDSELSLNGDVTIGYNGDHFGFVGHGDSSYYDLSQAHNAALTERYAGSLDMWALIALSPSVRLEPRLSAGAIYYGTLADDATTSVDRQTNQDSIFGRGVASLGVRVQPGDRFAFSLSAGVGGQYEDYYQVLQTSNGDQGTTFDAATTIRFEGQVRAQVAIVPRILSFRARADVNAFDMRRSDQAVTFSLGKVTRAEQGVTEISQTEIFARGFLDADVARFFGFVPAIHAGANAFLLSNNGASTSSVVPVFGIGIRREAL